ncbi:MAG: HEAT repeat domain-containing protein [Phycisphaerae bacterium]|nr:HEAT repeat domain-containing protein [Phycisphaerae bacterium]
MDPLIRILANCDACLRLGATEALGRIGDERAIWLLIYTLGDANADVRKAAAQGLASCRHNNEGRI